MSIKGLNAAKNRVIKGGEKRVYEIGKDLVKAFQTVLSVTGGVSAPGESPRYQTGDLYDSVEGVPVGRGKNAEYHVNINDPAAKYLNEGTSRMLARPFVGPAFKLALGRRRR